MIQADTCDLDFAHAFRRNVEGSTEPIVIETASNPLVSGTLAIRSELIAELVPVLVAKLIAELGENGNTSECLWQSKPEWLFGVIMDQETRNRGVLHD